MDDIEFSWVSEIAGTAVPVYMGQAYQSMMAKNDGSKSRLLQCSVRGETAYLPMLVRCLGNRCKEAYSAYGYGGLTGALTLSDKDTAHLRQYLAAESIVALFVRHSPFLANQHRWPSSWTELNRYTYATNLQRCDSLDGFLKQVPQKLRWSVNYARRAGLQVIFRPLFECPTDQIRAFYQLYSGLMQRKQISGYYLFSEDFFMEHGRALCHHCEFAEIRDEKKGELLAGAYFLLDETGWVHYHLSAASPAAMKLQGMELLLASALQRYGKNGYHSMHLGGGHDLDESDGLSRFKTKFSTERLDFCCTKLVCDETLYQRERARVLLKNPAYFLIGDARGQ